MIGQLPDDSFGGAIACSPVPNDPQHNFILVFAGLKLNRRGVAGLPAKPAVFQVGNDHIKERGEPSLVVCLPFAAGNHAAVIIQQHVGTDPVVIRGGELRCRQAENGLGVPGVLADPLILYLGVLLNRYKTVPRSIDAEASGHPDGVVEGFLARHPFYS